MDLISHEMKVLRAWGNWLDIVILSRTWINFLQIGHELPYKVLPYDSHFNQSLEMCSPWPIPYTNTFWRMWPIHLNFFAPSIFCTTRAKTVLILINFSDLKERRVSTERSCDLTCNQMQSAQPCAHYLLVINPGVIETASSQTHPMEDFPPISPNREYSSGFNCMATAL